MENRKEEKIDDDVFEMLCKEVKKPSFIEMVTGEDGMIRFERSRL